MRSGDCPGCCRSSSGPKFAEKQRSKSLGVAEREQRQNATDGPRLKLPFVIEAEGRCKPRLPSVPFAVNTHANQASSVRSIEVELS